MLRAQPPSTANCARYIGPSNRSGKKYLVRGKETVRAYLLDVASKFHAARTSGGKPKIYLTSLFHFSGMRSTPCSSRRIFFTLNLSRYCPRVERGWSWEMWVGCIYQVLVEHGLPRVYEKTSSHLTKYPRLFR